MDHLEFTRVELPSRDRRKRKGFRPDIIQKEHGKHGKKLIEQFNKEIEKTKEVSKKISFSPYLVLKVELEEGVTLDEKTQHKLESYNLKVIDAENRELMVLFAEDLELKNFKSALENYKNGVVARKKIQNEDLLKIIKNVSRWSKEDRIGDNLETLNENDYIDCYLWVFDTVLESNKKVREFEENMRSLGVRICDKYVSSSVVIVRLFIDKSKLDLIAENPLVYKIDKIPNYSIVRTNIRETLDKSIDEISYDNSYLDPETSSSVCVVDSGIFRGHPLLKGVVGDSKVFYVTEGYSPRENDIDGHGTKVASICEYGDFSFNQDFIPEIYLFNAKIHDGIYKGEYDLCYEALIKNDFKLDFDQQDILYDFFTSDKTINDLFEEINLEDREEEFEQIVNSYLNMYEILVPNQMRKIVDYFYKEYGCRIFNLSQGDLRAPYSDEKPRAWTCVLDELQNEYDILFVVSSGNFYYENFYETETIHKCYPQYFYKNNYCRVIDPANSISSVTVGSLALNDIPESYYENRIDIIPITKLNQPSSLSRVGPGINGSIKPDFVAFGGDRGLHSTSKKLVENNRGLNKLVFNNTLTEGLYTYDCGTSFAAPFITHVAANILNKYPNVSNNLVRALIANASDLPIEVEELLKERIFNADLKAEDFHQKYRRKHKGKEIFRKQDILYYTTGYGFPAKDKCLDSSENRVVLFADMKEVDEQINPDTTHIFEIPIPSEFRNSSGKKRIIVTLAFNPEVRKTRLDYAGLSMSFELIRGKNLEEVYKVCSSQAGKTDEDKLPKFPSKNICSMNPAVTLRSKGTLQKGVFSFSKSADQYGDKYYLVVNCLRNWSMMKQKYAIVVTLESHDQVKFYNIVKNSVRVKQRRRLKA